MSVILLNQSIIHYESLGRGRPVLFLHTWVGSWRYWVPSLQAAAASHTAYALDLYGFGESARNLERYAVDDQAGLVGSFLDEMGIGRIALVGHGLGAFVGLCFAAANPPRIARLLLTGLPLESAVAPWFERAPTPTQLLDILDGKGLHADELLPETHGIDGGAMRIAPEAMQIQSSIAVLREHGVPTLLVNGADDPLRPPLTADVPGRLGVEIHEIVVPDTGHFPMLDAPDAFHRLMVDFLALDTGTSPPALRLKDEWRRRLR